MGFRNSSPSPKNTSAITSTWFLNSVRELMAQEQQKLNNDAYTRTFIVAVIVCVLGTWMTASLLCGGGFAIAAALIAWLWVYSPLQLSMHTKIYTPTPDNFASWHTFIADSYDDRLYTCRINYAPDGAPFVAGKPYYLDEVP